MNPEQTKILAELLLETVKLTSLLASSHHRVVEQIVKLDPENVSLKQIANGTEQLEAGVAQILKLVPAIKTKLGL